MKKSTQLLDFTKLIHKDGYVFIIIGIIITFIASQFNVHFAWICFFLLLWCIYFFRNPDRVTPISYNSIISPADGIILSIEQKSTPNELDLHNHEMIKVSIFLSIFDVHVNRIAIDGVIKTIQYHSGKFFNASLDKASEHNERQSIVIETKSGVEIVQVQIAGLIARRIVCDIEENQEVSAGQRYGIIRFGSRVDVYMPSTAKLFVSEGQRVIAGETIIANLDASNIHSIESFEIR